MTKEDLEKLASSNPEVRKALAVFADHLVKTANEGTYFNESVPSQGETAAEPAVGQVPAEQAAAQPAPPMEGQIPPVDPAMMQQEQGLNPSEEGAIAAQSFLAPVFQAAAQGDPNAQAVIAKAAGEVAKGVAAAAAEAMGGAQAPIAPIAAPPTPEEEVANKIVPKENDDKKKSDVEEGKTEGAPPKENNEGPEKISMDLSIVAELIRMAKQGKL